MLKQDLRSEYRNRRKSISESSLLASSLAIANASLILPIWGFSYYHIFLPISYQKEIDTHFILTILQGKDKNVVLPKVTGDDSLKHYLLTDATKFRTNRWKIPEPIDGIEIPIDKIDVVFIPLLAFDKKGNRVGYGKGFYDTFLKECRKDVKKIGLSLFQAEDTIEDINAYDIPLDYCITPKKIYSFSVLAT
ncbi:5-formyltetrahydrofolate cyclo-ligase [Pricia antarctica]|uniref:5-formyltetrahydrofolate cyclo-ligase n=1 Tax=Pricia antarctica TaxID=641691 RepID=A0A1G6WJU6_9FLAO|nr:5-formyltetrahydrofolate cyclo-ligase [Pricia antarctica]SDD66074.1 5-formyltetrahydrofolate cyclo-ligase [Pricia antarctica]